MTVEKMTKRIEGLVDTVAILTEMLARRDATVRQLEDKTTELESWYDQQLERSKELTRNLNQAGDGHERLFSMLQAAKVRANDIAENKNNDTQYADVLMHLITEFEKYQAGEREE